ncbi:MAG: porin [Fluviicoccus sp.]|uniref:OprO/OprP family phosphate-selective porin n=1 Tax=Fluviicoccus sp. TaxID=2003552 RepID=UPI00271AEFB5|nr:porin [Fluviicoccus sp.]MDO8331616.1 porin [Fluviicoccus sp.]
MMLRPGFLMLCLVLLAASRPVQADHAAGHHGRMNMEQRLQALEAEIARLKAQPSLNRIDGGLRAQSADGSTRFRFFGRLQADYAFYRKDINNLGSGSELRAFRLGARGTVAPGWDYKLETEVLTGQKVRVTEGYLAYTGFPNTQIQIGNIFEMYGLEEYASAVDVIFMERSMAIDTFAPDYNQGIAIMRWGENWSLGAGLYGDTANNAQTKLNESWGSSARLVIAPRHQTGNVVSIGLSTYWRDKTDNTAGFSARPDSHITPVKLADTGAIANVSTITAIATELSWTQGPWSLQGEVTQVKVNRFGGKADATFSGGYLAGTYSLTGESRPWDMKIATYSRITPTAKGGAWELALRYDALDLNDKAAGITGGQMNTLTLGLNWYPNPLIRFAANLIKVNAEKDYDANGTLDTDQPHIAQLRAQIAF